MNFLESANIFSDFLKSVPPMSNFNQNENTKAGIVVTPWLSTSVPWYSMVISLFYQQMGFNCVIIWDDLIFTNPVETEKQNEIINKVLFNKSLFPYVIKLSDLEDSKLYSEDYLEIRKLAVLNTIWRLQTSAPLDKTHTLEDEYKLSLHKNLSKIKTLFRLEYFDHIVVPGGIYGNSGLYVWEGKIKKVRIATYDVAASSYAMIGIDDVASYLSDIPKLFEKYSLDPKYEEFFIQIAKNELEHRKHGTDKFISQIVPYSPTEDNFDIVMPLNIDWDAPALGKHCFFERSYQWIVDTIQFILDETDATIAVRQHPFERLFSSSRYLKDRIISNFGNQSRLRFFASNELINTYSLIEKAKIILPYVSTVGIEAAAFGKCVIVESDGYYSNLGFVQKANSKEDYFKRIKTSLQSEFKPNNRAIKLAWLCYYYTQVCNFVLTDFTPQPVDFEKWVKEDFNTLIKDEGVKIIIQAMMQAIPAAYLNSNRIIKNNDI